MLIASVRVGKAGYGWEIKIVDEKRNTVARGEVGELAVKGPGVMTCYNYDEKATNEVLADGWLFTGDMTQEDEDGFIFLVDRKKDVIISGGTYILFRLKILSAQMMKYIEKTCIQR